MLGPEIPSVGKQPNTVVGDWLLFCFFPFVFFSINFFPHDRLCCRIHFIHANTVKVYLASAVAYTLCFQPVVTGPRQSSYKSLRRVLASNKNGATNINHLFLMMHDLATLK